jgi:hypothetical protein
MMKVKFKPFKPFNRCAPFKPLALYLAHWGRQHPWWDAGSSFRTVWNGSNGRERFERLELLERLEPIK